MGISKAILAPAPPERKPQVPSSASSRPLKTNVIEHPELVADRIINYAQLVGRENVIAGTDCGFGTSADRTRVAASIS